MTGGPRVNFVMREALFEIYTWILCLSYLHEKQTSRIQSLYLYFIKVAPFLAMKYPFLNTQQGGIQNSRRSSRLTRHACRFMELEPQGALIAHLSTMSTSVIS